MADGQVVHESIWRTESDGALTRFIFRSGDVATYDSSTDVLTVGQGAPAKRRPAHLPFTPERRFP